MAGGRVGDFERARPVLQVLGRPTHVGPLGAGGMAEVMRARRADGAWEGEAAVKVLKRGMDSATVLARFALEQRALARLNHPHIAHLLDAGRSADGLPYFVMEHVDGVSLQQLVDRRGPLPPGLAAWLAPYAGAPHPALRWPEGLALALSREVSMRSSVSAPMMPFRFTMPSVSLAISSGPMISVSSPM